MSSWSSFASSGPKFVFNVSRHRMSSSSGVCGPIFAFNFLLGSQFEIQVLANSFFAVSSSPPPPPKTRPYIGVLFDSPEEAEHARRALAAAFHHPEAEHASRIFPRNLDFPTFDARLLGLVGHFGPTSSHALQHARPAAVAGSQHSQASQDSCHQQKQL